jgi:hypothetical protein
MSEFNQNKLENNTNQQKDIKINLGLIYFLLLLLSIGIIYFYSLNQNYNLKLLIPYTLLWPIAIIIIGISIFRVKNTAAFSVGFFITTLAVGLTIASIFTHSNNVENYNNNNLASINEASSVSTKIILSFNNSIIKSVDDKFFKFNLQSNYDLGDYKNYRDDNNVENIYLEQKLFPQGIGAYYKSSDISLPRLKPIALDLDFNLSNVDLDLSGLNLKSGYIKSTSSTLNIKINDLDIDGDTVLGVASTVSDINIMLAGDMNILISNSSTLSSTEFIGIDKDTSKSSIYKVEKRQNNDKRLILNLTSNFSRVKVKYE